MNKIINLCFLCSVGGRFKFWNATREWKGEIARQLACHSFWHRFVNMSNIFIRRRSCVNVHEWQGFSVCKLKDKLGGDVTIRDFDVKLSYSLRQKHDYEGKSQGLRLKLKFHEAPFCGETEN